MSAQAGVTEAVKKVLGEPVDLELNENSWKIRTNLMAVSLLGISIVIGNLHISQGSTFLGLTFADVSDAVLVNVLTVVIGYLYIHFLWTSFDALLGWRLRVTGTRVAFVTGASFTSKQGDYPDDPKQSTLYNWWIERCSTLSSVQMQYGEIAASLKELQAAVSDGGEIGELTRRIQAQNAALANTLIWSKEIEESPRITESLKRFDSWFELFLRSQNLRWLLIDFGSPLLLGAIAFFLLLSR